MFISFFTHARLNLGSSSFTRTGHFLLYQLGLNRAINGMIQKQSTCQGHALHDSQVHDTDHMAPNDYTFVNR